MFALQVSAFRFQVSAFILSPPAPRLASRPLLTPASWPLVFRLSALRPSLSFLLNTEY
jgi:hypothetical protein